MFSYQVLSFYRAHFLPFNPLKNGKRHFQHFICFIPFIAAFSDLSSVALCGTNWPWSKFVLHSASQMKKKARTHWLLPLYQITAVHLLESLHIAAANTLNKYVQRTKISLRGPCTVCMFDSF